MAAQALAARPAAKCDLDASAQLLQEEGAENLYNQFSE
jgi:hypothetical protein